MRSLLAKSRRLAVLGTLLLPATVCGGPAERAALARAAEEAPPPERTGELVARSIELRLVPIRPSFDTALVSNGIPLPPGWLFPKEIGQVRIRAGGRNLPLAVEALDGRHRDGSLRAVLVQTRYGFRSRRDAADAVLEIGQGGPERTLPVVPVTWEMPQAVALPRDPDYLVSTEIVGPTVPVKDVPRSPRAFRQHEENFVKFSDFHWNRHQADWEKQNYYDRALSHYAFWARSGDPKFWERATALAYDYRTRYVEQKGKCQTSPHWWQGEGLVLHYWLTGDDRSREAVVCIAARLTDLYPPAKMRDPKYRWNEGRIQQRVLLSTLLALRLGDERKDWGKLAESYVDGIIGLQKPNGSFSWPNECGYQANFMVGLQNDALMKYYDTYKADPRIPQVIKKAIDYMWTTQWRAAEGGFNYYDGPCPGHGNRTPSPDLNQLIAPGFAWYYRVSGDDTYRKRADEIFAHGVAKAYFQGSKQYNEQYYNSFNFLGYRRGAPDRRGAPAVGD